jgi:Holliday junction DNA helicase RuvB
LNFRQTLTAIWKKELNDEHNGLTFREIIGHEDIKQIFVKAMHSKKPVHLLLLGSPGSAKTMFLTEIMRSLKESYFVVESNATRAGIVNALFERRPKFLLIDELEKMRKIDQTALLHLMETGIISETKINKARQMELTSWVFASANSCEKIIQPLLSRFLVLEIPEYTFEQFREIAIFRLQKEKVDENIAITIAEKIWNELGSKDIRDVIKVARLASNEKEIFRIISMMKTRDRRPNK